MKAWRATMRSQRSLAASAFWICDLVEVAGPLLAVARDEGNGRPLARELEHGVRTRDADVGVARPEPRLERRRFRAHASRLRQRYQLATLRYGRQLSAVRRIQSGLGNARLR